MSSLPQVNPHTRRRAIWMLCGTCALWGCSFPIVKTLAVVHAQMDPEASGLLINASLLWPRFALAALLALPLAWRQMRAGVTPQEIGQATGLTLFLSAGMLFQVDGLRYTSASISAFLTQCYVIIIPVWVYGRARRWPPLLFFLAMLLVVPGVVILAGVSWGDFRLGRGELETIVAAFFFTGQILWLERPVYRNNRAMPMTVLMFALTTLVFLITAVVAAIAGRGGIGGVMSPFGSISWILLTIVLAVVCTFGAFTLMNIWQRWVSSTEAGLIYTLEPVFTAVLALFMPAMLSAFAGISYANEIVGWRLVVGGLLICGANVIIQLMPSAQPVATKAA